MVEIERKFLVKSEAFKTESLSKIKIIQGFLNTDPDRTVRIRVYGESGYITVKGRSNKEGTTRFEWEDELNVQDARKLLELCEPGVIEKMRYSIPFNGHIFEVDVFQKENDGLIIAEVELSSEDESFAKPSWLGSEVTGDIRYYNSQLSKQPYNTWKDEI